MFSENQIDQALEWVSDNDIPEKQLNKFQRFFDYVFLDEDVIYSDQERDYIFFLYSVVIHLFNGRIAEDIQIEDTHLENIENAFWEQLESSKEKLADLLYENCEEKELFAFLEDGLESDEKDPENIISSKELSSVVLVKMISMINYLSEIDS